MAAHLPCAPVRRGALAFSALSSLFLVPASADSELVVTSITNDGKLTFEDQGATGTNFYGVEWSNDLSSWQDNWSSLEFLQTQDGAATTVNVPLFYRVTRLAEEATALPAPVSDTDYRNGGAIDGAK